jgi:site-specific DNA-methyltransferase (adenine-specific)
VSTTGHGGQSDLNERHHDTGSAARFFYCAKASRRDRDEGLDDAPDQQAPVKNNHPTVKPTELMRWLCRLITPPGGVVLDPFMGSGSTGKAAVREGFGFIGIERDPEYFEIALRRVAAAIERTTPT